MVNIKFFKYASVDYMLDKDGFLNFMEVNDNTYAPYFIDQKSRLIDSYCDSNQDIRNPNSAHEGKLLSMFGFGNEENQDRKFHVAIVCNKRGKESGIERDVQYVKNLLNEHHFEAEIYLPHEFSFGKGGLIINSTKRKPDIIYRRNFGFPPAKAFSYTINDLIVRSYASNKHNVISIVKKLSDKYPELKVPETQRVSSYDGMMKAIKDFHYRGLDCIIKPNSSYGGEGFEAFLYGEAEEDMQKKASAVIGFEQDYLVQEKVKPALFRSWNGKQFVFDLRVMVYDGSFAAIEGRRSGTSVDARNTKSLITNIAKAGIDLIVVQGYDTVNCFESREIKYEVSDLDFPVDKNSIVLNQNLSKQIQTVSEAIVLEVDSFIRQREGEF